MLGAGGCGIACYGLAEVLNETVSCIGGLMAEPSVRYLEQRCIEVVWT